MISKALFLDRDGIINQDTDYAYLPEQIVFLPGIFDLCRLAIAKGYAIIIVTNQSGIGRGYYTEKQFHKLMNWMRKRFEKEGAPITEVYFCPYHPTEGRGEYQRDSQDRKPGPGMLLRAKADFGIDMNSSVMLGDRETDMMAGEAAGVGRLLWLNKVGAEYDGAVTIRSLKEAEKFL